MMGGGRIVHLPDEKKKWRKVNEKNTNSTFV